MTWEGNSSIFEGFWQNKTPKETKIMTENYLLENCIPQSSFYWPGMLWICMSSVKGAFQAIIMTFYGRLARLKRIVNDVIFISGFT